MNQSIPWILIPIFGMVSSCAIFAPDDRSLSFDELKFSLYSQTAPDLENRWWETFQSAELSTLVDDALTNAPSIQRAWGALHRAQAEAVKAGAARIPSLGAQGKVITLKDNLTHETAESYALGLNASYELDLWGRVRSASQAAALDHDASREQLHTVAISLSSQVALNWIGIVAQQLQTELIKDQLISNQTTLELIELRFRNSLSSALDVYQQRQNVASTQSLIPQAKLRESLLHHSLTALLGHTDFNSLNIFTTNLPALGPLPAIGIPADVLANRPDVRRAGFQLQAADWSISAARADRLPAIRLTAEANYENIQSSDLFDDWFANLIGNITGPIFEGGRRNAEVKRTRAIAEERLADYRETVINAIKEVEDALVSEQKQREFNEHLDTRLLAARRSYEQSINRYRNGIVEYTTVLIQLNSLQGLERGRIEAQYNLLRYRINLYRALGGSWPNTLSKSEESK